jgi:hypothetical protein
MRWQWILVVLLFLSVGCGKQQYATCQAPDDHLKVMFKAKIKVHPFSHSFCIICNTEIEPSEYADWAVEMGAPQGPSNPDGVHPCLYVYGNGQNTDSLQQCKSLACGGDATYNDMVGKSNGNFNLGPILNNDSLVAEEWILLDDANPQRSMPLDQTPANHPDLLLQK